jgi:multidrug resistance protein
MSANATPAAAGPLEGNAASASASPVTESKSTSPHLLKQDDNFAIEHESLQSASTNTSGLEAHADDGEAEEQAGRQDLEQGLSRTSTSGEVYSAFTRSQRILIVFIAAFAGFISPLSGQIYFPALNSIAASLDVSLELVNLTLTTYMIFQGLAPMFVGGFADSFGRRPAYLIAFTIYVGANIGLALQDNYVALLVLRCVQSAGSSGTVALTYASVADVSTSAERGTYVGWAGAGLMLGPAIGPILGGAISQRLGWHAIFWFLTILSAIMLLTIVVLLPETGRNVVGNGSIPPPTWGLSLVNYIQLRRAQRKNALERTKSKEELQAKKRELSCQRKVRFPNPIRTLRIVAEKDVALLLFNNSMVFASFVCVISSLPQLLRQNYGFDDLQIGLSFIPFGFGCAVISVVNGRVLDWNFRRVAKQHGITISKNRATNLRGFPVEKARLQCALPLLYAGVCIYIAFGWLLYFRVHYIGPLVLLFFIGATMNGSFNVTSTFLVDLYPQSPAMATAANNLVRCLIGAAGAAAINKMLDAMGFGWTFTLIAFLVAIASGLLWILLKWGPKWREERYIRIEKAEKKKQQSQQSPVRSEKDEKLGKERTEGSIHHSVNH